MKPAWPSSTRLAREGLQDGGDEHMAQIVIGMRKRVMPGARMLMIVVM